MVREFTDSKSEQKEKSYGKGHRGSSSANNDGAMPPNLTTEPIKVDAHVSDDESREYTIVKREKVDNYVSTVTNDAVAAQLSPRKQLTFNVDADEPTGSQDPPAPTDKSKSRTRRTSRKRTYNAILTDDEEDDDDENYKPDPKDLPVSYYANIARKKSKSPRTSIASRPKTAEATTGRRPNRRTSTFHHIDIPEAPEETPKEKLLPLKAGSKALAVMNRISEAIECPIQWPELNTYLESIPLPDRYLFLHHLDNEMFVRFVLESKALLSQLQCTVKFCRRIGSFIVAGGSLHVSGPRFRYLKCSDAMTKGGCGGRIHVQRTMNLILHAKDSLIQTACTTGILSIPEDPYITLQKNYDWINANPNRPPPTPAVAKRWAKLETERNHSEEKYNRRLAETQLRPESNFKTPLPTPPLPPRLPPPSPRAPPVPYPSRYRTSIAPKAPLPKVDADEDVDIGDNSDDSDKIAERELASLKADLEIQRLSAERALPMKKTAPPPSSDVPMPQFQNEETTAEFADLMEDDPPIHTQSPQRTQAGASALPHGEQPLPNILTPVESLQVQQPTDVVPLDAKQLKLHFEYQSGEMHTLKTMMAQLMEMQGSQQQHINNMAEEIKTLKGQQPPTQLPTPTTAAPAINAPEPTVVTEETTTAEGAITWVQVAASSKPPSLAQFGEHQQAILTMDRSFQAANQHYSSVLPPGEPLRPIKTIYVRGLPENLSRGGGRTTAQILSAALRELTKDSLLILYVSWIGRTLAEIIVSTPHHAALVSILKYRKATIDDNINPLGPLLVRGPPTAAAEQEYRNAIQCHTRATRCQNYGGREVKNFYINLATKAKAIIDKHRLAKAPYARVQPRFTIPSGPLPLAPQTSSGTSNATRPHNSASKRQRANRTLAHEIVPANQGGNNPVNSPNPPIPTSAQGAAEAKVKSKVPPPNDGTESDTGSHSPKAQDLKESGIENQEVEEHDSDGNEPEDSDESIAQHTASAAQK